MACVCMCIKGSRAANRLTGLQGVDTDACICKASARALLIHHSVPDTAEYVHELSKGSLWGRKGAKGRCWVLGLRLKAERGSFCMSNQAIHLSQDLS
jgi:hypothetical protein